LIGLFTNLVECVAREVWILGLITDMFV